MLISTKPWKAIGPPKSDNHNNSNYSDVKDFDGSSYMYIYRQRERESSIIALLVAVDFPVCLCVAWIHELVVSCCLMVPPRFAFGKEA